MLATKNVGTPSHVVDGTYSWNVCYRQNFAREAQITKLKKKANGMAAINNICDAVDSPEIGAITTTASRSRKLDTDYVSASVDLAHNQIIQPTWMAMIAQAKIPPEVVLELLRT